jgi:hypothetical protein
VRVRKGAEPQEGRQSRERRAACAAHNPLEPRPGVDRREHFRPEGHEGLGPGSRLQGGAGECPGGANTQEGKVRRHRPSGGCFRSPSRSESTSGVAAARARARAGKRQERRGPERGTAGREEQGPEGRTPWTLRRSTGRRQARRGASRREGDQTLRAEGAGGWNPRVIRILRAGLCRRGRNPRRVDLSPLRGSGTGRGNLSLQRRAKRMIGAPRVH